RRSYFVVYRCVPPAVGAHNYKRSLLTSFGGGCIKPGMVAASWVRFGSDRRGGGLSTPAAWFVLVLTSLRLLGCAGGVAEDATALPIEQDGTATLEQTLTFRENAGVVSMEAEN